MLEKLKSIEKKKIIIVLGFLLLIVVILFGGAFAYNKFFYKRSYSEVEDIMVNAAKSHLTKNPEMLPKSINGTINLTVDDLVTTQEMENINEYLKDESISCDGNVTVTNINNSYRYTAKLDCGDTYKTKTFIDFINSSVPVVESGNGLYKLNDELVYRGDNVNNYIKFSGKTYRIVKFTSNNNPVIILTEKTESIAFDDRYNVEKKSFVGINDYSVSRMKEYLDNLYKGTSLITEEKKLLVIGHNIGVGKRKKTDTDKSNALENSAIMENQYISLLTASDYLNASLDKDCTATTSPSCVNYNYLSKYKYNWWTITADAETTHKIYRVNKSLTLVSATNTGYVRPVLQLVNDALYVSGDGSKDNPYIVG